MRFFVAIMVFVAIVTTGCGALMQGTSQTIPVQSSPNSVSMDVAGVSYMTPTSLELQRKNEYILNFSKEGYDSAQIRVTKHLSGGYLIADVLLTGLIGVIVDAATGAWYNLKPEAVTVSLSKISNIPGPDEIEIAIEGIGKSNKLDITSSVPDVDIHVTPVK